MEQKSMPEQRHRYRWSQPRHGAWFLEPSLLLLLHHNPAHGYALVEQLNAFGLEDPHPRVVYRILRDMEKDGWVRSTWDVEQTQGPPRRVYRLTALGDEMLSVCMQDMRQTRGQIDDLLDACSRHMKESRGKDQPW
jgi:DNA-binding PadR family transcriptional regulator